MANTIKSYVLAGTIPNADDSKLRLFYLFDAERSLAQLIEDVNHDLSEVPPGSEARDVSTNRSWVLNSSGNWLESNWYGPNIQTTDDIAQVSYVQQSDAQVLKEAKVYSDTIAGAATANIKVVVVKPSTPIAKTMYYVGVTNPYDIYYYDEDLVEHSLGTSDPTLTDYQTKNDDGLATADKTIVGAINELKALEETDIKINNVKLEGNKTSSDLQLIGDDNIKEKIIDLIYPVGSIYMSTVDASPASFLGGLWQKIEDKFLLGVGPNHASGTGGGQEKVNFTPQGNLTQHDHEYTFKFADKAINSATSWKVTKYNEDGSTTDQAPEYEAGTWSNTVDKAEVYGKLTSQALVMKSNTSANKSTFEGITAQIETMPPYLTVFMWKRIS